MVKVKVRKRLSITVKNTVRNILSNIFKEAIRNESKKNDELPLTQNEIDGLLDAIKIDGFQQKPTNKQIDELKMTKEQIEAFINAYQEYDKLHNEIVSIFGFDGTLCDRLFAPLEKIVNEYDKYKWIHWYVFETEYGKTCNEVEFDGKKIIVKTIDDLMEVMK